MIDRSYPAVPLRLAISPGRTARVAAAPPVGAIAHRVVTAALAAGDVARAERAARLAHHLLPGEETAALDLARVRAARRREG